MSELENEIQEIPCPKCRNKVIKIKISDMISRREAKCSSCKSKYEFGSSEVSTLKSAIHDLEKAQDKYEDSLNKIMDKAKIIIIN